MKIKALFIVCVPLALGFGVVSMSTAGISVRTEFFTIIVDAGEQRNSAYGRVNDGRLALTDRKPWSDWEDRKDPRPDRWYVLGTKIKSSAGGGYLAYDPSGKDPRVYLSRTAGEGTDWKISDRELGNANFHNPVYGVTQAASGGVKGWHLDVEESEEKGKDGKTAATCRLVLRKDVVQTKVHITPLCSYRATAP